MLHHFIGAKEPKVRSATLICINSPGAGIPLLSGKPSGPVESERV
jgi:hypothetical protein